MSTRHPGTQERRHVFRRYAVALVVAAVALWVASRAGGALVVARELPTPDALIGLASHEWERLPDLASLAHRHREAVVLLTEPVHPTNDNCYRCGERIAWLASLGISPQRVVVLPRRGRNTYDEAVAAFEYCRSRPVTALTIITSPYHTRRALASFEAVFQPSRIALGVHPATAFLAATPERWWLRAYDRWYVRYEWAALTWYVLRHRVSPFVAAIGPHDLYAARHVTLAGNHTSDEHRG